MNITLEEARELLGVGLEDVTDEELSDDIATAQLLKNIFFDWLKEGGKR